VFDHVFVFGYTHAGLMHLLVVLLDMVLLIVMETLAEGDRVEIRVVV
jgi:hypothetical protein